MRWIMMGRCRGWRRERVRALMKERTRMGKKASMRGRDGKGEGEGKYKGRTEVEGEQERKVGHVRRGAALTA